MSERGSHSVWSRYRRLFGRDAAVEVDDEIAFHLEMRAEEAMRRGADAARAREAALERFGDLRAARTECLEIARRRERRRRRTEYLTDLGQDLRYGVRKLLRAPAFTAVAVMTLSLGIGAATALFGAADQLLLRPLPLREPERLAMLALSGYGGNLHVGFGEAQVRDLEGATAVLEGVAATSSYTFSLREGGRAEELPGMMVSADYFGVLGVRPALGRFFVPGEGTGAEPAAAAVISHRLWRQRLGSDPAVIGRTLHLSGTPFTVIGVAPRGFSTGRVGAESAEVWVPLASFPLFEADAAERLAQHSMLWPIARIAPGVSHERATRELAGLAAGWNDENRAPFPVDGITVRPLDPITWEWREEVTGFVRLLGLATALILLVAGINVAGMLLARSVVRRREIGIRIAIGADRGRVVRQLLVEGLVLFAAGGVGGVLVAIWLAGVLVSVPWPVPVELETAVNGRVLGFALLVSFVTGVGFTLLPALQTTRVDVLPALRDGASSTRRPTALRGAVVVVQVALSVVLLTCAALFGRALQKAWSIDPGFDPDGVIVSRMELQTHGYTPEAARDFDVRLLERARGIPGVEAAALGAQAPFATRGGMIMSVRTDGSVLAEREQTAFVSFDVVSPGYFETLRIPLLAGRAFTATDGTGTGRVAVVNRALADHFWPGEDPIGKWIGGQPDPLQVVGVVGTVATRSLQGGSEEQRNRMYLPVAQQPSPVLTLHLRTRGGAAPVHAALRSLVREMDPALPPPDIVPLNRLIGLSLLPQRIGAWVVGGFGVVGLLLAMLGLYGLLYYTVVQRTREIGIRIALGARPRLLLRHFVAQGTRLASIGALLGIGVAAASTRLIAGLLYGVSELDPIAFGAVALLLGAVALVASVVPARRAVRVDPMVALRTG